MPVQRDDGVGMKQELVQVSLPNGSVVATFAAPTARVAQVVDQLLHEDGLDIAQAIAGQPDAAHRKELWALQRVLQSEPNKAWSDEDLLTLGDGEHRCSTQ